LKVRIKVSSRIFRAVNPTLIALAAVFAGLRIRAAVILSAWETRSSMWNGAKAGRAQPYAVGDDVSRRITQPSEKMIAPARKTRKRGGSLQELFVILGLPNRLRFYWPPFGHQHLVLCANLLKANTGEVAERLKAAVC
jgi:hypothetical protein